MLPERATSEAELPPTLWTGMPSMLLEPGYPSAAAAVKKRVADEEAAARAKLSSQCGERAQTRERFLARKGAREALEDEIASWATDALQSTASKPARRSSLMSLDGIPAHLTADEVRGSTAARLGASAAGLGATTAPPVEPEPQRPQAVARVRRPLEIIVRPPYFGAHLARWRRRLPAALCGLLLDFGAGTALTGTR